MRNLARKYDREFKMNAVKLHQESGKSVPEIASNLGIPESTLSTWVLKHKRSGNNSFPGSGNIAPCNDELYRLRRELNNVKQERDILKKAVAIFSKIKD